MTLQGKKVAVIGLGKSGLAAYELLQKEGAQICLYDGKKDLDVSEYEAPVYLGDFPEEVFAGLDLAVFSPGVPLDIPVAEFLKEKKVPIIGEIELAYQKEKGQVAGITGTNGKTTTTTLAGEIMKAYNPQTFVVGNIGNPYTKEVLKSTETSVTVAEISSFQLETIDTFHPAVSAVLNITPDHLNRHKTMECYIDAKMAIAKNQTKEELCVLNYEDEVLRERAGELSCRVAFFSSKRKLSEGLYQNEKQDIVDGATGEILMNMRECHLPGDHNCENIMAAILITRELGVPMEEILSVVREFQAVEHRVEYVTDKGGVDYYNDSKGTNPDAAIKGIQSMSRPTILIGGGYDKGGEFDQWIQAFDGRVKKLLLLGETKERIARTAEKLGFTDYEFVDSLGEAVTRAAELAESGDAVLLSPACASWDMFDSYEQRGTMFKEFVRNL
ncbi:MAG: UDP-N-acetylmuramoyl-L-alanine--D-glutamate ligase [Lachnospiraceae bacterium]|nr:UDP-N-acetylmuramoyl-L-alanine--D-glutamate ligase [Lachnospiraceae bacterium]